MAYQIQTADPGWVKNNPEKYQEMIEKYRRMVMRDCITARVKPGQTWYNKSCNFPVKVIAANSLEVLIQDKATAFARTRGHQIIDRAEFLKYYKK